MEQARVYYAKHITAGAVNYRSGASVVDEDVLLEMDKSFAGKPVIITHNGTDDGVVGYVVESFFNKNDGAHWAKIIITHDAGENVINNGYFVSNFYNAQTTDERGQWRGFDYVNRINSGEYQHLALVNDPRYEDAVVITPEQFKSYNENREKKIEEFRNSLESKEPKMEKIEYKGEELSVEELLSRLEKAESKVDGHKEFEAEEEKLEEREEQFMENRDDKRDEGQKRFNEEGGQKHRDDMEALKRRIYDSIEDGYFEHAATLLKRMSSDNSAEKENGCGSTMKANSKSNDGGSIIQNARANAIPEDIEEKNDWRAVDTSFDRMERARKAGY